MTISRLLKNIWPILLFPAIVPACGDSTNFIRVPDNFSNFRRANLIASDQTGLTVGRSILDIGGNAADATVAMGFAAMVSLPARMGLEAHGHCVGYDSKTETAFNLDFNKNDYHAVHGLTTLHAAYGKAPWPGTLAPAHNLALLGGNLFSHTLNGGNAPHHLVDTTGKTLPRPTFVQTLETLGQYPAHYRDFAPFADQPKWQNRLSLDTPKMINSNDNILAYAESPVTATSASSIIFGAIDATGLAISCSAGYGQPYGIGWNMVLDSAIPETENSVPLPKNIVSYNDQNHRVRWLAAFAANTPEATILHSWDNLLEDNRPKLNPQSGFAMSYCPIGLPNEQFNKDLKCATYSGALEALGRASRQ